MDAEGEGGEVEKVATLLPFVEGAFASCSCMTSADIGSRRTRCSATEITTASKRTSLVWRTRSRSRCRIRRHEEQRRRRVESAPLARTTTEPRSLRSLLSATLPGPAALPTLPSPLLQPRVLPSSESLLLQPVRVPATAPAALRIALRAAGSGAHVLSDTADAGRHVFAVGCDGRSGDAGRVWRRRRAGATGVPRTRTVGHSNLLYDRCSDCSLRLRAVWLRSIPFQK